jgi:integrase
MGVFRREKSQFWYVSYTDHNGIRHRQSTDATSKTEAQAIERALRTKVREGRFFDNHEPSSILFSELLDKVDKHARDSGIKSYGSYFCRYAISLKSFFGDVPIHTITGQDIERYKLARANEELKTTGRKISKTTVNHSLAILKRVFNLAIRWDLLQSNPVKKVDFFRKVNGRTRFLSEEEQARLLGQCEGVLQDVVLVAMRTGMRLGEVLSMKKADIDFNGCFIYLKETKSGEPRAVPMMDQVKGTLAQLAIGKADADFIFVNRNGDPYKSLRTVFESAVHRAGLKDFRFHDLRHTFASDFLRTGGDIYILARILGHSTVSMTERYGHLTKGHMLSQLSAMEAQLEGCAKENVPNSTHLA